MVLSCWGGEPELERDAQELAARIVGDLEALDELTTEPMRHLRRAYSRELRAQSATFVCRLAQEILATGKHRWIAYELIYAHPAAYRTLDNEKLKVLGQGIDSWDSVDSFARTLAGPAWRDGLVSIGEIQEWARSADRWWRRAALVSTVALNVRSLGGKGDVPGTLTICEMLVDDRDDTVVKALSWALRQLVVHDPEAVRAFLKRYDRVLAARVKREVTNKLETGLKNPSGQNRPSPRTVDGQPLRSGSRP